MAHRCGFYRALVVNTNDPEQRGRIQVVCAQLWGNSATNWIWPMNPPASGQAPAINSQVWIGFEAGDEDHPLWFGGPSAAGSGSAGTPTGIVKAFLGTIAPVGYLILLGQLASIALYPALFGLIGTTWGGDGTNNFGLPDMRGRTVIGAGQGSGLSNRAFASSGGEENHVLSIAELASHAHSDTGHNHGNTTTESASHAHGISWSFLNVVQTSSSVGAVAGGSWPVTGIGGAGGATIGGEDTAHVHGTGNSFASIAATGSGTAHNNMQPWAALNWLVKT